MAYKPCNFDRSTYLDAGVEFEAVSIHDAKNELCEFSNDAEDLAFELAYTRYGLAKIEEALKDLVDLKKYKDKHGKDKAYRIMQQGVWKRAKNILDT